MSGNDGESDAVDTDGLQSILMERPPSSDDLEAGGPDREEIREELVEEHLPVLEEAGVVEWDRDTGEIEKGPDFDEIESVLKSGEK